MSNSKIEQEWNEKTINKTNHVIKKNRVLLFLAFLLIVVKHYGNNSGNIPNKLIEYYLNDQQNCHNLHFMKAFAMELNPYARDRLVPKRSGSPIKIQYSHWRILYKSNWRRPAYVIIVNWKSYSCFIVDADHMAECKWMISPLGNTSGAAQQLISTGRFTTRLKQFLITRHYLSGSC